MAGVNRAAVAVTDTFDVWRVRTNELNSSLNAGTHAKTADTIVWRDDNASLVANVVTANTLTMTHGTGEATIVVKHRYKPQVVLKQIWVQNLELQLM